MSAQNKIDKSDSAEQRKAEEDIRISFQKELAEKCNIKVSLTKKPIKENGITIELDGFSSKDDSKPICVEIWARQAEAKSGQKNKIMKDMCKLLLAERLLEKPCQKYIVATNNQALSFLNNSWMGDFAKKFGIKFWIVKLDPAILEKIGVAENRQGEDFSKKREII